MRVVHQFAPAMSAMIASLPGVTSAEHIPLELKGDDLQHQHLLDHRAMYARKVTTFLTSICYLFLGNHYGWFAGGNSGSFHFIGKAHIFGRGHIVRCADGVHAHILHRADLATDGRFVNGSTQRA